MKGEENTEITQQYGFQLTESEIQEYIFSKKQSDPAKEKAFAQLECLDCLMLTNQMLEQELMT